MIKTAENSVRSAARVQPAPAASIAPGVVLKLHIDQSFKQHCSTDASGAPDGHGVENIVDNA
jgi:hypothetical protein